MYRCIDVSVCYNDFSKMGKDFHKLFSLWASPMHEVDAWSVVKRSEYLPYSHSSFFNKRRRERRGEEEVREILQGPSMLHASLLLQVAQLVRR